MRFHFPTSSPRTGFVAALALVALIASGCAEKHISGMIPEREPAPAGNQFVAGAARVDLTPIPGIPMNYSMDGKVSRGFWTRLFVRAIYLQDQKDQSLVLISCEFPHIPNGLGDRIAEILGGEENLRHIGRENLLLAATHTHNGPENFFSSALYNSFPSPRTGFDPQLFEFFAQRIVTAVRMAYQNKEPASVNYRSAQLDEFFRNRSTGAFREDAGAEAFLTANDAISDTCLLAEGETDGGACRAVRTAVEVVELVGAGGILASAVFLAAHPTVLGKETTVFQSDVFGVAATLLEQGALPACGSYAPVVAVFNGAQGDVSVTWKERNRWELLNTSDGRQGLAVDLSKHICGASAGIEPVSESYGTPDIRFDFKWIPLGGQPADNLTAECEQWSSSNPLPNWHERCTTVKPRPGMAGMGGAQDGRTLWYELGLKAGLRSPATNDHGRKFSEVEIIGIPIDIVDQVAKPETAPKKVPVAVYRIGSLVIATLPGEFTTVMGERIREAVGAAANTPGDTAGPKEHVLLVGLANGHVSYVTTPEEYDAQFYEGANNFHGPATGPMIQAELAELAKRGNPSIPQPSTKLPARPYHYDPGVCRVFQPHDAGLPTFHADDGLQNILLDLTAPASAKRDFMKQCWIDAIPKLSKIPDDCTRSVPYVWIEKVKPNPADQCNVMFDTEIGAEIREQACSKRHADACTAEDPRYCSNENTLPEDNCGLNVVTVLHGSYMDRTRWCAFWMPPNGEFPHQHRICAAGITDQNIVQAGAVVAGEGTDGGVAIDLDRFDRASWIERLLSNNAECCGFDTRDVCEWPLTP